MAFVWFISRAPNVLVGDAHQQRETFARFVRVFGPLAEPGGRHQATAKARRQAIGLRHAMCRP